jgi:phosphate acetyltransferase
MELIEKIKQNAKKQNKRIVLPEGYEERNLRAADIVLSEGLSQIVLIGDPGEIKRLAGEYGLRNIGKATIIDPKNHEKKEEYIDLMVELRKHKGLSREEASRLIENPLYLGVMMIKNGDADGEVSGAIHSTGDVLRPAFQYIKTAPGISVVSGAFIMILKDKKYGDDGVMVFADCAVHPSGTDKELAEIAVASAATAKNIACIEPRIALLSFSTKGSAKHELVDKVVNATKIAKEMAPELLIDGELQADAALVESIGQLKAPGSKIAGKANVLVFPDLASGNIAYKLVQRLAGAEAIGPILQGMAAPINDLSRGCSVDDIVNVIAITSNQAAGIKKS